MEEIEEITENHSKKRPNSNENSNTKKRFKQPTVEELNELNETRTLFKNNLFRLQIEELLNSTKIKNKHKTKLNNFLNDFQSFLNTLPIHDTINISEFSKEAKTRPSRDLRFVKNLINNCKNNLLCDQDIPITFIRPESVATFGLYKIDSLPGPNLVLNIHLTIPKKCFNEKDHLNNRYFVKKFYFLMYIAEHLKSTNISSNIKCGYYNENIMLPYLILTPANSEKIRVNVFAIPEQNHFRLNRVLPDANNVKSSEIFAKNFGKIDDIKEHPTSFYNASLAFDFTLNENNLYIEQMLNVQPIQDGLKLILIWMNQRGLNKGLGAFSNELIVYIVLYMTVKNKVNKHMSSYQVFRNFLNFMNNTDLSQSSLSINEDISDEILSKFRKSFDVVLLDKTGFFNVAAFLNLNVYIKMRAECKLAFDSLDQATTSEAFSNLFLLKIPQFLQYDAIVDIKSGNNLTEMLMKLDSIKKSTYLGHHSLLMMKLLQDYLNIGLNKRAVNVVPFTEKCSEWEYGLRYKMENPRILYGITLNPDCAFDILEFGPTLNDPLEQEFREFWGKLASNRRFRDGTAKIIVHFETSTIRDKREIIRKIVDYVLDEKLKLEYKFHYNTLEDLICTIKQRINCWYPLGTNEETCMKIVQSSDELGKKIRTLDIQLGISGINGISNVYCYTNVFPPIPTQFHCGKSITSLSGNNTIILKEKKLHAAPKHVEPIECVLHLEHSSKWPNDLEALQSMKTLFLLQISKLLNEKFGINSTVVKSSHIDILYQGTLFRYHIFISKEIGLLKRSLSENKVVTMYKDTETSLETERKLVILPKIIGALKGVQSQFPSFGVGACLAKRWIRSQMIDEYLLPEIAIDLLCAHQFTGSYLYAPAASPQVAYMRFLKFLSEFKWEIEPVVINFNDELSVEEIAKIDSELRKNCTKFKNLHIITPYDQSGLIFTKSSPSREVLIRLSALAKECLNLIEKTIIDQSLISLKTLFIPNCDGFDCIIHLKSLSNPRRHEHLQRIEGEVTKINFEKPQDDNKLIPVIDFDPVQLYLKELRDSYGQFCIFFHDTYGGNQIGVLWNPKEIEKKEVKLSYLMGRKIEGDKLVLDLDEIVKGFDILGKDIVKSIDLKN